ADLLHVYYPLVLISQTLQLLALRTNRTTAELSATDLKST
ncbi:MAG: hypothetical protein JWQ10_3551, partial [Herbaspirillum sp.]|nr:hypothetical protein [Herbaspirillum sp.]